MDASRSRRPSSHRRNDPNRSLATVLSGTVMAISPPGRVRRTNRSVNITSMAVVANRRRWMTSSRSQTKAATPGGVKNCPRSRLRSRLSVRASTPPGDRGDGESSWAAAVLIPEREQADDTWAAGQQLRPKSKVPSVHIAGTRSGIRPLRGSVGAAQCQRATGRTRSNGRVPPRLTHLCTRLARRDSFVQRVAPS